MRLIFIVLLLIAVGTIELVAQDIIYLNPTYSVKKLNSDPNDKRYEISIPSAGEGNILTKTGRCHPRNEDESKIKVLYKKNRSFTCPGAASIHFNEISAFGGEYVDGGAFSEIPDPSSDNVASNPTIIVKPTRNTTYKISWTTEFRLIDTGGCQPDQVFSYIYQASVRVTVNSGDFNYSSPESTVSPVPTDPSTPPATIIIAHYHSIPTNPDLSTEQLLSGNKLNPFKVCADGSNASIFKLSASDNSLAGATIRLKSDPYITDTLTYGRFIILPSSGSDLIVRYRHPNHILVPKNIEAEIVVSGVVKETFQIKVFRAPALLIHGLWSDDSAFTKMEEALVLSGYYTSDFLARVNYKSSNYVSFNRNNKVVPDNITALISKLRETGIAAGKVDIAGHSMGGILSRLYLQSVTYRNDMHKLITINTPHSGAQMANLLLDVTNADLRNMAIVSAACLITRQFFNNTICNDGAVDDLRVDSPAIRNDLNGSTLNKNSVPSHAIVTIQNPVADIDFNNGKLKSADKTYILKFLLRDAIEGGFNLIFNPDIEDDLIVALSSQKGGLSGPATSLVQDQVHIGSPANSDVINIIKTLLGANPSDEKFSQNGFNPVTLNYQPQWRLFPSSKGQLLSPSNATLTITSPQRGSTWLIGSSVPISSNGTGLSTIKTMIDYNKDSVYVAETSNLTAAYTANAGNFVGKRKIVVTGQTPTGEIITDSTFFYVSNAVPTADLTPIVYARPTATYGTADVTMVVDIVELNGIPTNGPIIVKLTKDAKVSLTFSSTAISINNRSVQNSLWTLVDTDPNYYALTTTQPIGAGDKLSFGLTGKLTPGATTGLMTASAVIIGSGIGEDRANNNIDADKVEYFQQ